MKIIQFQPEVRSGRDRDFVVGVEVSFAAVASTPQFGQNLFGRRRSEIELPEVPGQVRFPSATEAPPLVPDEAQNAKPLVTGVVAPGNPRSPLPVVTICRLDSVIGAIPVGGEVSASGFAARLKREVRNHTLAIYDVEEPVGRCVLFAFAFDFDFDYDSDYDFEYDPPPRRASRGCPRMTVI